MLSPLSSATCSFFDTMGSRYTLELELLGAHELDLDGAAVVALGLSNGRDAHHARDAHANARVVGEHHLGRALASRCVARSESRVGDGLTRKVASITEPTAMSSSSSLPVMVVSTSFIERALHQACNHVAEFSHVISMLDR